MNGRKGVTGGKWNKMWSFITCYTYVSWRHWSCHNNWFCSTFCFWQLGQPASSAPSRWCAPRCSQSSWHIMRLGRLYDTLSGIMALCPCGRDLGQHFWETSPFQVSSRALLVQLTYRNQHTISTAHTQESTQHQYGMSTGITTLSIQQTYRNYRTISTAHLKKSPHHQYSMHTGINTPSVQHAYRNQHTISTAFIQESPHHQYSMHTGINTPSVQHAYRNQHTISTACLQESTHHQYSMPTGINTPSVQHAHRNQHTISTAPTGITTSSAQHTYRNDYTVHTAHLEE